MEWNQKTSSTVVKERATFYGYENIETSELLEILVGKLDPALGLLSVRDLLHISKRDLLSYPGIGTKKADQIMAAIGLSKKLSKQTFDFGTIIRNAEDAYECFKAYRYEQQEHFIVGAVSTKQEFLGRKVIYTGTRNQCIVNPPDVFRYAIEKNAAAIIVAHNHPSGDTGPSQEDIELTKRLMRAGNEIGIEVLDHLILGHGYYSLRERGCM
ncbi:JAB domain-containing protein [Salibacterium aidingense]|uniref:JAB domain-containing protein n=1 Tax=Salibacterium aidingense TaxID=384933 RepID=UPI0003FBEC3E|nr:DNA repair protein RadC [Salibacterium aidingense]